MERISNFITTGNFKSIEIAPKEVYRRLEDHTSKVKEMFDLVLDSLSKLRTGIDDATAKVLITSSENTAAYVGGSGVVDHSLLASASLTYAGAMHVGFAASVTTISTTAPLTGGGDLSANRTIAIPAATASQDGYLTAVDWAVFNGKQAAGTYLTDAPGDNKYYARRNATWAEVVSGDVYTDLVGNTAVGTDALASVTLGGANTAYGWKALTNLTTGSTNTVIGSSAGQAVTFGIGNTFLGVNSGINVTTGSNNIFLGAYSGAGSNASNTLNIANPLGTLIAGVFDANPSLQTLDLRAIVSVRSLILLSTSETTTWKLAIDDTGELTTTRLT